MFFAQAKRRRITKAESIPTTGRIMRTTASKMTRIRIT